MTIACTDGVDDFGEAVASGVVDRVRSLLVPVEYVRVEGYKVPDHHRHAVDHRQKERGLSLIVCGIQVQSELYHPLDDRDGLFGLLMQDQLLQDAAK